MGKYLGPLYRKSRRLQFSLLENNKEFTKYKQRVTIPGEHGPTYRSSLTTYGKQLLEKQKIQYLYNIKNNQLKLIYKKATKLKGLLHLNFLILLESRLDSLVFRANLTPTRKMARQLVSHKNILVDGKCVNIPSAQIRYGQKISIKKKLHKNVIINKHIESVNSHPKYLDVNFEKYEFTYVRHPEESELNKELSPGIVIEFLKH